MPSEKYKPFTIRALLRLTRFWNLVIIGISQYFTAIFLIDRTLIFDWRLLVLVTSTVIIAAAGYIINDYYDIKIDLINKPQRVVIGKSITRRYALFFHSVLVVIGVGLGFVISWRIGVVNFLSAFLLWWYSNSLKRQPLIGNLVVAVLTSISILLINILYYTDNLLVIIYALFAFFMTLIREILKDMEDLRGDNTFGCKTLPIVWGIRKTKGMIYGLLILLAASVLLLNARFVQLPFYYFVIFLYVPLGLLVLRLIRADTRKDFYWLSQWCKVIMLLGIFSMVFIN